MALRAYMSDAWVAAGAYEKVRESRFLLRALVSLMASTGITPGLEVETLTPAQVAEAVDSNGRPGLRVAIRDAQGKRKPSRVVWARVNDVWPVIRDMRALLTWINQNATEKIVGSILTDFCLLDPATACSTLCGRFPKYWMICVSEPIRSRVYGGGSTHAATITHAELAAWRVAYNLSKNMGNSERMIRMHYDHVLIDMRSGILTGSDQVIGTWLLQRGNLEQELDRIANDPDDHLSEEDGYRR